MSWEALVSSSIVEVERGYMLKFPATYPFENEVVMMVCEEPDSAGMGRSLMTITGYKAGINCYVTFPRELMKNGLSRRWLIDNWSNWVVPDGNVETVYVRQNLRSTDVL
jgi:hypothetical protein